MANNLVTPNWQIIAEQLTVETDGDKLCALANELCAALDEEARRKRLATAPPFEPEQARVSQNGVHGRVPPADGAGSFRIISPG